MTNVEKFVRDGLPVPATWVAALLRERDALRARVATLEGERDLARREINEIKRRLDEYETVWVVEEFDSETLA